MALSDVDNLPTTPSEVGDPDHDDLHDLIHGGLKSVKALVTDIQGYAMDKVATQTIAGVKEFQASPILSGDLTENSMVDKEYVDDGFAGKEPTIFSPTDQNTYVDTYLDGYYFDEDIPDETLYYYAGDKTFKLWDKAELDIDQLDNTLDLDKPISILTQAALDDKEPIVTASDNTKYYRGDKTWVTLDKAALGVGNVDNTSDLAKPISSATASALADKADLDDAMNLTGNQEVTGTKTFSSSPKLVGSATVDYVWVATNTDGSGEWAELVEPETTVDWNNVTDTPATYPATIGTSGTTAAAGNHSHTKADIGLGNVDNTADADKPVTNAETTALGNVVTDTRTISAGTGLTGGGSLAADRTLSISNGGVGVSQLSTAAKKEGIAFVQTLSTRATGTGQIPEGFAMPFACNIVSVKYRMGTADASGTTTVELRKNGSTVSGSSGTASTTPTAVTGSWGFSAGDALTVYTTAVGTTPGLRLTADIIVERS